MARNTAAIKRGFSWDYANSALDIFVNGVKAYSFTTTATTNLPAGTSETVTSSSAFYPATSDGNALGTTSHMWSDLFLASGAVINFNNGDVTLTHATDVVTFSTSKANAAMDDGYGMWEVDATLTGTTTGHAAAASAWINIGSGVTCAAGKYVCARNDGVYEDSGATITNAKVIFGSRMQKILGDTDALSFPFSVNTNNTAITAVFDVNNLTDMGATSNAGSSASLCVPFMRDANGTIKYILLYDLA